MDTSKVSLSVCGENGSEQSCVTDTSHSLVGPSATSSWPMVQKAIRVGKFYGQELRLGVENKAAGDCSIEVCMDQLNFRPEFDQMRLDEGEPQFYRETWFREIERVAWGTVFSEDYTESEWKTGWEFMRQPRNYEHALGDMVMAGIAHCNRVDILVISAAFFLSDPSPIIVYPCNSLTDSLLFSKLD